MERDGERIVDGRLPLIDPVSENDQSLVQVFASGFFPGEFGPT
jgi:hypothetical protein